MASTCVDIELMNPRYLDVVNEPEISLMPIEGYEKKPLVCLEDSIVDIKAFVRDLDRKVWLAKRESADPKDKLTRDESAAIRLYTMQWETSEENLCTILNQTLRKEKRTLLKPWFSYLKLFLTALHKLPSVRKNIWRGVHGDISDKYKTDVIWWGFSSCTETMNQIDQFLKRHGPRSMFMIECLSAKSIQNHSFFPDENEFLLMPGTYLKVVSKYSPAKDLHIIHLREEIPPYPMINPPFSVEKLNEEKSNKNERPGLDWLYPRFHDPNGKLIKRLHEIECMIEPQLQFNDEQHLNRVLGSIFGLAIGEAVGCPVENRPRSYMMEHPLMDMTSGDAHGLQKGQYSRCTSMALCLASSLISQQGFNLYDQLVRYKWWYRLGFMSSTGKCFDIGASTERSLKEFEERQKTFSKKYSIPLDQIDSLTSTELLNNFDVLCDKTNSAGNEALVRLAPVPLFFSTRPIIAIEYAQLSAQITHGDIRASDACRYLAALIIAALHGYTKQQLLDDQFYERHRSWFSDRRLHPDILSVNRGSYKRLRGYDDGIRGIDFVVQSLKAALWAFWSTSSFEEGVLAAVHLGQNTATTAAIYGQLAGVYYGYQQLPKRWSRQIYARDFLKKLSMWIIYEGENWTRNKEKE